MSLSFLKNMNKLSISLLSIVSLSLISCSNTIKINSDFSYASTTYQKNGQDYSLSMNTLYTNQGNPHYDSFSKQRVLVVPLGFVDEGLQNIQTKENITKIKTVFFGGLEETSKVGGYYSVKEFYEQSSYGKSSFEGDVLDNWIIYPKTSSEFLENYKNEPVLGDGASKYVREYYISEYNKPNHGQLGENAHPLTYYDQNNDGFIDLLWIIHSHKSSMTNLTTWWSYVNYKNTSQNILNPEVKTYGFASIDTLTKGYNGYDSHLLIHETGHAYGLLDYYDYSNNWSPLGKIDMMDSNVGDHNAFSKFTLGWLSPLVINDDAIITLRDTSKTGDCFILPSPNYNNTVFDEYIMVEFISPNGFCYNDYSDSFGFTEPGVRITHCDARVFKDNHDAYLSNNPENGHFLRINNTKGGREGLKIDSDYFIASSGKKNFFSLLSLIECKVKEDYNCLNNYSYQASNETLFKKGDYLNLTEKNKYTTLFLPSETNMWNKAKTINGWKNSTTQNQQIDESYTINFSLEILDIIIDDNANYSVKIKIEKN